MKTKLILSSLLLAFLVSGQSGGTKKVPVWFGSKYEFPVPGTEFNITNSTFKLRLGSGLFFDPSGAVAANNVSLPAPVKFVRDRFLVTSDGLASFTLNVNPAPNCTQVFRNGLLLDHVTEYTLVGRTVNVINPVGNGDVIIVHYFEANN